MSESAITTYNEFYADADLSRYAGEWVAIIENKVVAHGKNLSKILKEAKKENPRKTPFVAKIPIREILLW